MPASVTVIWAQRAPTLGGMRWQDGRRSTNVEDRRGQTPRRGRAALKLGGAGTVIAIVAAIVLLAMGEDPSAVLDAVGGNQGTSPAPAAPASPEEDQAADFIRVVLADTEDTWTSYFRERGQSYQPPTLVLFREGVDSACGFNTSAVGPFYCPGDRKVYLDLSFFGQLEQLGAPGDFAQAYVVGHEVGHHLQTLMGTSQRVRQQRQGLSEVEANQLAVRQELQADCYAGVWAHYAQRRNVLEPGDLQEGLRAAASIGDDTLQRRAHGRITPETWTHGSSAQRMQWFQTGFQSGRIDACDTFGGT